jgi:Co/Zn/Cd efflux system component
LARLSMGMALAWRARAAVTKGGTLIAFALWVLGSTAWHAFYGTLPRADVMGVVGIAALIANGGVALMLYCFRTGDANMRSVWICSRNDAVGNAAVLAVRGSRFSTLSTGLARSFLAVVTWRCHCSKLRLSPPAG